MAELALSDREIRQLADTLKGRRIPAGVRRGTWHRIVVSRSLDVIEGRELSALARCYPEVIEILGIPVVVPIQ